MKTLNLDKLFEEANDFSNIEKDPLLNGSLNIDSINNDFNDVYKAISGKPFRNNKILTTLSKVPVLGLMLPKVKSFSNKLQSYSSRLDAIFIEYTNTYNSLLTSIDLYKDGIATNEGKINVLREHLNDLGEPKTDNQILYVTRIKTLIKMLEGTVARSKLSLDSACEMEIIMKMNKPIFQTMLNTIIEEKAAEIGLRTSKKSFNVMNNFINKMMVDSTDNAIKLSDEISKDKYSMDSTIIAQGQLNKLSKAFEDIKQVRIKAVDEAKQYLLN